MLSETNTNIYLASWMRRTILLFLRCYNFPLTCPNQTQNDVYNRLLKMSMWWSCQGRACRPMMIVDVMLHSSSDDLVLKRCLCDDPAKVGVMPCRAWTIWSLIRRDTQERDREDNGLFHSRDTSTIPMIQYTYLGSACYAVWHYLYLLALRWYMDPGKSSKFYDV